jgi:hypothetical protein
LNINVLGGDEGNARQWQNNVQPGFGPMVRLACDRQGYVSADFPDGAQAYRVMFLQAQGLLRQGFNVICDSPLTGPKAYGAACEISEVTQVALRIVACHCSDEALWAQRLEGREKSAHQAGDWQALLAYQEKVRPKMQHAFHHPLLQVDMAKPLAVVTAAVVAWLNP